MGKDDLEVKPAFNAELIPEVFGGLGGGNANERHTAIKARNEQLQKQEKEFREETEKLLADSVSRVS